MPTFFVAKGNLGGAPALKQNIQGPNGTFDVATMRVMFGRYRDNGDGDMQQVGGFWREVEVYGHKAHQVAKHLRRGARVLVVGEEREFTARDDHGNEVQAFKIVAEDVALTLNRVASITFEESTARSANREEAAA